MSIFGIEFDKEDLEFKTFMSESNERLQDNNIIKNPYTGELKRIENKLIYVVNMNPIYINFTIYIWPLAVGIYFWRGISWLHIPMAILLLLGLFWSKYFIYFMLRIGVRKSGSKTKLKLLNNNKLMEDVFF